MEDIELKELFNYLKSKIFIFIAVFVLFFSLIYFIFNAKTESYYSIKTKVLVLENKEELKDVDFINTYIQIMLSNNVLQNVLDNLEYEIELNEFKENIKVQRLSNSSIFEISYNDIEEKKIELVIEEFLNISKKEINKVYNNNVKFKLDIPNEVELVTNYSISKKCFLSCFISSIISFIILFSSYLIKEFKTKKAN